MDGLAFIAELIKALAWPVTVFSLVVLLRRPLTQLIPLLQRLKYRNLELEFGERVEEIKAEAQAQLPAAPPFGASIFPTELSKLAEHSPRSVVLESWSRVESAARQAAERAALQLSPRERRSPLRLVQALRLAELIEPDTAHIMHDLRTLRNEAAHAPDFTLGKDAALNFADVAARLVSRLDNVRPLA